MLHDFQPSETVVEVLSSQREALEAIKVFERKCFPRNQSWADELQIAIKKPNIKILFCRLGEKVIGYIIIKCHRLNVHIVKILVMEEYRRQGLAMKLIQASTELSKTNKSMSSQSLHVDPENEAALALYRKLGFDVEDVISDYYSLGKAAWRMTRQI